MTAHGPLVARALARLAPEQAARALADVAAFLEQHARVMAAPARVAPYWRRPLAELLAAEGTRRARIDDRTWTVWDAYGARLRKLEAQNDLASATVDAALQEDAAVQRVPHQGMGTAEAGRDST